jgi:hypothetical protein
MKLSRLDWLAVVSYVAGGGLAVTAAALATVMPHYQTQILAISAIAIGVAGMLARLFGNPTPTNTVQVFDRTTGSTVEMKTVDPPSATPAPPPTYTTTAASPQKAPL